MKTNLKLFLSLLITVVLVWACSSNDDTSEIIDDDVSMNDDVDPMGGEPDGGSMPMDGQIIFPDGSDIDLNGATITTAGKIIAVASDGTVELPSFEGATELAFLSNSNNQILLTGFISEGREQLSIASTATVLFYFASTAYLQNEESKTAILTAIEENEEYLTFVNELENLFLTDNLVLQNMGFLPALEASTNRVRNINTTNSAVFVESNDIRSRIQIQNATGTNNSFTVTNRGARRAEVFIYKKAFTDIDDNRQIVDDNIAGSDTPEFPSEPLFQGRFNSKNFTDFNVTDGNLFYVLNSCGNVFRSTTSEPILLTLEDNENSAEFEVTVIGPGQNTGERDMTTAEREVFERISTETFLLDYVLPTLFDIAGRKQAYDNLEGTSKDATLVAAAMPFFDSNTEVMQLVFEGEYDAALQSFFGNARTDGSIFQLLETVYEEVFNNNDISGSFVFTDVLSDNLSNMTEIIEGITSRLSFFCTDSSLGGISTLESWELTADRGEVTLEPLRTGVQIFNTDLKITANIEGLSDAELNNGSITYEWSVSENFDSFLFDDEGNRGVSFTNNSNSIGFASFTAGFNLLGFENIETVTVRAFREVDGTQQLAGTSQMTVNVQDRAFRISPQNTILNGIEQVNLNVLNVEDGSALTSNNDFDFRIFWSTNGRHALFNGNSTTETVLNNNSIILRNLDDKAENATQSVRAEIFLRPKNNPNDIPFRSVGFEFVTVYIANQPDFEFEVSARGFVFNRAPEAGGIRTQFAGGFIVPFDDRVESYRAEVLEFEFRGETVDQFIGNTFTWTNESQSTPIGILQETSDAPGDFGAGLLGASVNTIGSQFSDIQAQYQGITGKVKISIFLKDE